MALIKNDIPVLEYDDELRGVIMPNVQEKYSFPSKALFLFLCDEIEKFAKSNNAVKIGEFVTITKTYNVYEYEYKNQKICMCQAPLGAPAAAQLLDFLIACGVKKVIAAGSCGALENLDEDEFIIPCEALRDEGTSYKYLPPSRTLKINEKARAAAKRALENNGIKYIECKVWTTDGFYRETPEMVLYRKSEGFKVVDMECAALVAVSQLREVEFAQILFTADTLANIDEHQPRNWGYGAFSPALRVALDAISELD